MHAVRVTVISPECLRIEYAPGGRFVDHPSLFAIHGPGGDSPVLASWRDIRTTGADAGSPPIVIETDRVRFEYTPDGRPPHAGNMRALVAHPSPPPGVPVRNGRVLWTPEAKNHHNLGGTLTTLDGLRGPAPLGDGLLARDGWSLIDDSHQHLLVDGWARTRESEGVQGNHDWYLFAYGADYRAALRALAVIAGRVPLPRRCAMGSWFSRYWPYTSAQFRGISDEYQTHGFPLDVMVLDMDWHKDGWTGWSWNRELLPDAEELVSWLHEHGLAVTLNLHPADGVGPHEDRYADFMHAIGREPDGSRVPFDAGDRQYMTALFEKIHMPLERPPVHPGHESGAHAGVDFWWLDWQQDQYVRSIPGLTNLRWLNHLYSQHTQRAISKTDAGVRGLSFSRWAGVGDHRNPIHFSGDAHTGWAMLAFQVRMTAVAGNVGCFYWSHDIGGHFGPRFEETTARWVQFGALSPVLRLHSARTHVLDRRPWTYEERFCDSMRGAFQLRSQLFPYIYTAAAAGSRETVPLLRPMYIDYAGQERSYRTPHQYMLGEDLLAAPITEAGLGERCVAAQYVWFPIRTPSVSEGATNRACLTQPSLAPWFNWSTGEKHPADSESILSADIDHIPLFARAGAIIPTQPVTMRMTSEPLRELVLRCFPGEDGQITETSLYEDDGISLGYTSSRHAITPLRAEWRLIPASENGSSKTTRLCASIRIGPTLGAFDGQLDRRSITIEIGAAAQILDAKINGVAAPVEHEADTCAGLARVRIPERSIRDELEVQIEIIPTDTLLIAHRHRAADLSAAIGKNISIAHLRDTVIAECRADAKPARDTDLGADRTARLLAIGAGIGAVLDDHAFRFVDTLGWIDAAHVEAEIIDRVGRTETTIDKQTIALESASVDAGRAADLPLPKSDLGEPPLGLRATRLARFRFNLHGAQIVLDSTAHTRLRPITAFRTVGPFPWDWRKSITDQVYAPESSAPPIDPNAMFHTDHGETLVWRPALRGDKWDTDFRRIYPGRAGLGYAATSLVSTRRQPATLHLDSGDKLEAWLNGVKVFSQDGSETHAAAMGHAKITLEAGRNALLIKCSDGGGGWGFTASVEAEHAIGEDADHAVA